MFVIAGVTGHVGRVVAEELVAKGKKIKVIVREAAKGAEWSKKGAEVAVGALDDASFVAGALKGAAGFFTLVPPNYQAPDFFATQRKTADAIASAVRASGVQHVVLLSSVGADLAEGTGPIRGLHYAEDAIRGTGAKLSAIRAGSFQENVERILGAAKGKGIYPNFVGTADTAIPMVATHDIGKLAAEALLSPPAKSETVDLVGPAYSARQVAEKLGAKLGKKLDVIDVPQAAWVSTFVESGMSKQMAEIMAEMYGGFASGAIRPRGDRLVKGTTAIDEVIANLA